MAYALVASTSIAAPLTTVTTASINTTGADLIVVGVSQYVGAAVVTVTDSKANTWTPLTAHFGAASESTLFYTQTGNVGSGHTITAASGANYFGSVFVLAFSGSVASAFDVQNGATTTGTSLSTGSITPSVNNSLVVSIGSFADNSQTPYNCTLLTVQASIAWVVSNNEGGAIAWAVQTPAAPINPSWSWTTSAEASASIASFKPAAGAASGLGNALLLGVGGSIVRRDFRPIRALLGGRES